MDKSKKLSLIMCVTPLQLLIAEKIIIANPKKNFFLVMFPSTISERNLHKSRYYFDKVKLIDNVSCLWYEETNSKGIFKNIYNFLKIKLKFDNLKLVINEYYLASIDSIYFQYFLSKKNQDSLVYTFDDGVANIYEDSVYYIQKEKPMLSLFLKLMGVSIFQNEIKKLSVRHYTIFYDFKNIINNTEYIDIFGESKFKNNNKNSVFSIFLGQPLDLMKGGMTYSELEVICHKLEINQYFPHPVEENKFTSFEIVQTNLIFEDYIKLLFDTTDYKITVYSLCSTAALSLLNHKNINVIFVKNEILYRNYYKFYDLIVLKGGCVVEV